MGSSGPPADARFADTIARARTRASVCADASETLAAVRGGATSADGSVTAVVDGRGALVALTLTDAVAAVPAARLAASIVETTRAAARTALLRREAVLLDLLTDLGR